MIIYYKGLTFPYLIVFDIEHDSGALLQFAGLRFSKLPNQDGLYQLERNLNFYITRDTMTTFIECYTGIERNFLHEYGIGGNEASFQLNRFFKDCTPQNTILASHNIQGDIQVLQDNTNHTYCYPTLCTYQLSQKVLKRNYSLRLEDIATECAYPIINKHNAYGDTWGTAVVLSYLLNLNSGPIPLCYEGADHAITNN